MTSSPRGPRLTKALRWILSTTGLFFRFFPRPVYVALLRRIRGADARGGGYIHLHSIELLALACKARDAGHKDFASRPNALADDAIMALVMAVVAAESFINELPEVIEVGCSPWIPRDQWTSTPKMVECAMALRQAEAGRKSVVDKYRIASKMLSGTAFDKGRQPFQDFVDLVRLRNEIAHLKPAWSTQDHRARRIVKMLDRRRLTFNPPGNADWSWFNKLMHPAIGTWACQTVREVLLALFAQIPAPSTGIDPLGHPKAFLRDASRFPP